MMSDDENLMKRIQKVAGSFPLEGERMKTFVQNGNTEFALILLEICEKNAQKLAEKDQMMAQKLAEKDQMMAEKDQMMAEKDQMMAEKDQTIFELMGSSNRKKPKTIDSTVDDVMNITLNDDSFEKVTLEDTFHWEYQETETNISITKYIQDYAKKWEDEEVFCPYFPLVQSSGYGKTRLLKTLQEKDSEFLMCYVCLRKSGSDSFPRRNPYACTFFERIRQDIEHVRNGKRKENDSIPDIHASEFDSDTVYIRNEKTKMDASIPDIHAPELDSDTVDIAQTFERQVNEIRNWILKLFERALRLREAGQPTPFEKQDDSYFEVKREDLHDVNVLSMTERMKDSNVTFLLAFDEARNLFGPGREHRKFSYMFRVFRHALNKMVGIRFMCILTDTTSTLSNYIKPQPFDPSHRKWRIVIPPYYLLYTMDVMLQSRQLGKLSNFWKSGRPLWSSLRSIHESSDATFKEIRYKLLGPLDDKNVDATNERLSAVLGMLTGFPFVSNQSLGEKLVSNHLATLLSVSDDRQRRYVRYVPDVVLAYVACKYYKEDPKTLLEALSDEFLSHLVIQGERGELCVQLLFLLQRRVSFHESETIEPELLVDFFFSVTRVPRLRMVMMFENMYVNFTHFHPISRNMDILMMDSQKVLKWCYDRCLALMLPPGWPGADLLIPIKSEKYTCLLVQVKNRKTHDRNAIGKLNLDYIFGRTGCDNSWLLLENPIFFLMELGIQNGAPGCEIKDNGCLHMRGIPEMDHVDKLVQLLHVWSIGDEYITRMRMPIEDIVINKEV